MCQKYGFCPQDSDLTSTQFRFQTRPSTYEIPRFSDTHPISANQFQLKIGKFKSANLPHQPKVSLTDQRNSRMHFTAIRNRVTDYYTNLPSKSSSATVTCDFYPVAFVDTMQLVSFQLRLMCTAEQHTQKIENQTSRKLHIAANCFLDYDDMPSRG